MKTRALTLLTVLFAALSAWSATTVNLTYGDRVWTYTLSGGKATIIAVSPTSGNLEVPAALGGSPVVGIADSAFAKGTMRSVSLSTNLTSIGSCAFAGCVELTSVVIPTNVTSVGEEAFAGCTGLKSVTVPQCICSNGLWFAFDADKIVKVVVADGVTEIGDEAFAGCYNLESVTLPSSLEAIGDYAFESCYALKRVKIPNKVGTLGDGIFQDCFDLESVTLPSGITKITAYLFAGCYSLTSVNIPSRVCEIYPSAFEGCMSLTRLSLPNSVSIIGDYAFADSGIESLTLPNTEATIGEGAFAGCYNLAAVTITQKMLDLGVSTLFDTDLAAAITIAEGVTEIPDNAFEGFANITSVKLPDSVEQINIRAFYNCCSLVSVNLPKHAWRDGQEDVRGVQFIGVEAFFNCRSLTELTIPESVETIGGDAFAECYGLKDVTLPLFALGMTFDSSKNVWVVGGDSSIFEMYDRSRTRAWENVVVLDSNRYRSVSPSGTYPAVLADGAFEGLPNLKTVTLPSSVVSIGARAFKNCAKLEGVTLSDWEDWYQERYSYSGEIGTEAFYGCSSLVSVDIPDQVTCIGDQAFSGCRSLAAVELPEVTLDANGNIRSHGVWSIGSGAFQECVSLASINLPERKRIDGHGSEGGVTSIGGSAFFNCRSLTELTIPESVETIGGDAFRNCYGLKDVTIPASCLNSYVFMRDGSDEHPCLWENVVIRGDMEYVDEYMFYGLAYLKTVMLPHTVKGIGYRSFYGCVKLESVTIEGVKTCSTDWYASYSVGEEAFYGCSSLTKVDIPSSVTRIERSAFQGCVALTGVTLPDCVNYIGDDAFAECSSLTSVNFPDSVWREGYGEYVGGVREIGDFAFYGCMLLTSAPLPNCLERIGFCAFESCCSLRDVRLPKCVFERGVWDVFSHYSDLYYQYFQYNLWPCGWETVVIGDGVTEIGYELFWGNATLKMVSLPASIQNIDDRAFRDCTKLESVTIRDGVVMSDGCAYERTIGEEAFSGCAKLTKLDIPDGVTKIERQAFYGCGLTDVTLPDSVTEIDDEAFCASALKNVIIPDGVMTIGNQAFCYCGLTRVDIPDSVTTIKPGAFLNCYALKDVTLPKSVFDAGVWEVFRMDAPEEYPCAWESVAIGAGVTNIAARTFEGLAKLKKVTVPASVTGIGTNAFASCEALASITFGGNAPTSVGVGAFDGVRPSCTVWVKKGSTGWGVDTWQGMTLAYLSSSLYLPSLESSANVVATQLSGGWKIASANDKVLSWKELASVKVSVTMADGTEVETTDGYDLNLSSDGKSAVVTLKTPALAMAGEIGKEKDPDDPSGTLVDVPESALATKPTAAAGETVGALPVKTVPGLWYQASWGDDLGSMTQGAKVQATGDSLYLGVIKQAGASGFYRISVSEK